MSCPLASCSDSFLAAPGPCNVRSVAKAEELSLTTTKKRPLAFPGAGSSQCRKVGKYPCSLRGWGWRGQPSWGRKEDTKRQRHAATMASIGGAHPIFQTHASIGQNKSSRALHSESISPVQGVHAAEPDQVRQMDSVPLQEGWPRKQWGCSCQP